MKINWNDRNSVFQVYLHFPVLILFPVFFYPTYLSYLVVLVCMLRLYAYEKLKKNQICENLGRKIWL